MTVKSRLRGMVTLPAADVLLGAVVEDEGTVVDEEGTVVDEELEAVQRGCVSDPLTEQV